MGCVRGGHQCSRAEHRCISSKDLHLADGAAGAAVSEPATSGPGALHCNSLGSNLLPLTCLKLQKLGCCAKHDMYIPSKVQFECTDALMVQCPAHVACQLPANLYAKSQASTWWTPCCSARPARCLLRGGYSGGPEGPRTARTNTNKRAVGGLSVLLHLCGGFYGFCSPAGLRKAHTSTGKCAMGRLPVLRHLCGRFCGLCSPAGLRKARTSIGKCAVGGLSVLIHLCGRFCGFCSPVGLRKARTSTSKCAVGGLFCYTLALGSVYFAVLCDIMVCNGATIPMTRL
eukprot:1147496-Pelagomonas_calceolata.AAC.3